MSTVTISLWERVRKRRREVERSPRHSDLFFRTSTAQFYSLVAFCRIFLSCNWQLVYFPREWWLVFCSLTNCDYFPSFTQICSSSQIPFISLSVLTVFLPVKSQRINWFHLPICLSLWSFNVVVGISLLSFWVSKEERDSPPLIFSTSGKYFAIKYRMSRNRGEVLHRKTRMLNCRLLQFIVDLISCLVLFLSLSLQWDGNRDRNGWFPSSLQFISSISRPSRHSSTFCCSFSRSSLYFKWSLLTYSQSEPSRQYSLSLFTLSIHHDLSSNALDPLLLRHLLTLFIHFLTAISNLVHPFRFPFRLLSNPNQFLIYQWLSLVFSLSRVSFYPLFLLFRPVPHNFKKFEMFLRALSFPLWPQNPPDCVSEIMMPDGYCSPFLLSL